jgi:3-oxoacyl-[acyl-carrier protein] reductase
VMPLITGASRGSGREVALRLAFAGPSIAVNHIDDPAEAALPEEVVRRLWPQVGGFAVLGDVSDRRHVERIVNTVLARFGHVDILVSNASITNRKAMLDVTMSYVFTPIPVAPKEPEPAG